MTNKPTNLNAHMRPGQALGTFTLNEQSVLADYVVSKKLE